MLATFPISPVIGNLPAASRNLPRGGIVQLRLPAVLDAQHGGFATGWGPVSWGSIDEFFDAPICQDGRSGGFTELLARAEVSHDALIDFPSEKAFKASDDVPFRPSIRPASDDIVDRRLVIAHTDHDGSMEGGVRLSVAACLGAQLH